MLKDLIYRAKTILDQTQPSDQDLMEAENALSAYLEALATERISEDVDFVELEHANRLLRDVRRERSRRIAEEQSQQGQATPTPEEETQTAPQQPINISPAFDEDDAYDPLRKFLTSSHDPQAEEIMNMAEEAFYAGNYQKAISHFEKVLKIEPGWSRAQEHRDEAEEFLRTGNIPSVALPPEAGKAYGKAQSAARVFRYQTALDYLEEAFASLKEAGIKRWREGETLRQDLENQMQANAVYEEGMTLLSQGNLQGALVKVQTAASAVALPEYVDKVSEIRGDLAALDEIGDVINLRGNIPPEKLSEARTTLDRLSVKYSETPQITRLRNRMDIILPSVAASLADEVDRLKRQGDSANTLKAAKEAYTEANDLIETLRTLQPENQSGRTLGAEMQGALQNIEDLEDSIQRANQSLNTENRYFPRNAFSISKPVQTRFPEDPEVLDLKRRLRWYHVTLYGGGVIAAILLALILWFGGRGIANAVQNRQLSLTPSPTATGTVTPTPTITPSATITPTATPLRSPTPIYSPTATPVITGTVLRNLFARNGCYESFTATGRIPEGAVVSLIAQSERTFDSLNRECVLIEYRTDQGNVIGYVLLADMTIP